MVVFECDRWACDHEAPDFVNCTVYSVTTASYPQVVFFCNEPTQIHKPLIFPETPQFSILNISTRPIESQTTCSRATKIFVKGKESVTHSLIHLPSTLFHIMQFPSSSAVSNWKPSFFNLWFTITFFMHCTNERLLWNNNVNGTVLTNPLQLQIIVKGTGRREKLRRSLSRLTVFGKILL